MNKKIMIISNTDGALYKFRGALLRRLNDIGAITIGVCSPSSPEGSYLERLSNICRKLYPIDFARQGWMSALRSPFKIYKIYNAEQPDVVHIYGHEALIYSFGIFLASSSARFIVTITGLGRFFSPQAKISQKLAKHFITVFYFIVLKSLDKIIFLNAHDLKIFSDMFPRHKNKFMIINGEGSDFPLLTNPKLIEVGVSVNFLFASRLMEEKGIIELLRAFQNLPNSYQLVVLGTIDDSVRHRTEIKALVSNRFQNVKYFGFVSDISDFLTDCDCLILPTKYMEGLPIILVEALAKGKFIITSKAPGCADTLVENVNGFFLDEITPEAISKAVKNFNPIKFKEAHNTSTALFLNKFCSEVVIKNIIHEYGFQEVV